MQETPLKDNGARSNTIKKLNRNVAKEKCRIVALFSRSVFLRTLKDVG
jgi:hypothetical protein